MKNFKGFFISGVVIVVLAIVIIFTIVQGKSQATESNNDLKAKVDAEMLYLDDKILSMLHGLNNIVLRNYIVTSKEVGQSTEGKDDETSGVSKNSDESQIESNSSTKDNESKTNVFELKEVGVLITNKDTDWETLKAEIEILHSSWITIILDLYKVNVNSKDILEFSRLLDEATINIKNEDKTKSLNSLARLYSYIAAFTENYTDDSKRINLQKTKSSVINAYSLVESERWDDISKQIANASLTYTDLLNSVSTTNDYDVNKGYILLKELENSISERDKDIFYIKYKNLIEKLNNMT